MGGVSQHAQQIGLKVHPDIKAQLTSSSASLGQPGVLRAVAGAGLYLAVLGLLALGSPPSSGTPPAPSRPLWVVLVLPLIVQALPNSIPTRCPAICRPTSASSCSPPTGSPSVGPAFSPWTGFGLLCLYTVVILAVGCWVLVRRDA